MLDVDCRKPVLGLFARFTTVIHKKSRAALRLIAHLAISQSPPSLNPHPVQYRSADRPSASPLHARGPNNRQPSPLSSPRHTKITAGEDGPRRSEASETTICLSLEP